MGVVVGPYWEWGGDGVELVDVDVPLGVVVCAGRGLSWWVVLVGLDEVGGSWEWVWGCCVGVWGKCIEIWGDCIQAEG